MNSAPAASSTGEAAAVWLKAGIAGIAAAAFMLLHQPARAVEFPETIGADECGCSANAYKLEFLAPDKRRQSSHMKLLQRQAPSVSRSHATDLMFEKWLAPPHYCRIDSSRTENKIRTSCLRRQEQGMHDAGHATVLPREADAVSAIAEAYLAQAGGDAAAALRRAIGDALADLAEMERHTRRVERLVSRGFVRGAFDRPEN